LVPFTYSLIKFNTIIVNTPPKEDKDEDEAEDKSDVGDDNSSEGGIGTETPLTPFSPAPTPAPVRKKFPSELKSIKCTFPGCDKSFNRPVRLEAHIRTHTDDRACKCPYPHCEKAYYEDKHLQQHIKGSHKSERTYVCDREGCGKSFLTGTRLRRHIDSHKGFDRFKCSGYPGCNKAFRKHQTLQRHIRSDHLKLAPYICSHIDPVTKIQCGAGYDGAVGLRKHVEKEHTPSKYVCTSCVDPNCFNSDGTPKNLGFSTELQLQNHIRKEHADCLFCDMQFSGRRELQAHIESQHSGKSIEERRVYSCPRSGCNKSFTTSSNLASHIRGAHEGQKFVCGTFDVSYNRGLSIFDPKDACGKTLASKANLEDHIRTAHLGLASELNVNRVAATYDGSSDSNSAYASNDQSGSDSDSGYQLLEYKPKPQATRKSRRYTANIIDQLVGNVQASDPRRTLACPARGCDHKFIRQYDLDNHMFSVHPAPPFPPFPESPVSTTLSLDQQFAPQDHFWIGDTSPVNTSGLQAWRRDEVEMRRLIDEEHIDPALVGL
jgi:general transcription factor IIIA